jgi:DNA-directed RNA polymerase specialized sigma24 family protein
MPLKVKITKLLSLYPHQRFTYGEIARRFQVNTGAVGSAVKHIVPKKLAKRIVSAGNAA